MFEDENINPDAANPIDEIDGQQRVVANQHADRIHQVQIKIPPFWKADLELWFLQIEAQFASANIRSDLSKYNQIVGKLDTDTLSAVSDIVKNPPENNKYQAIKIRLTNQFAETDRKKLKTLFRDLSLDDDKPSDLFRKMKDKSCNRVSDDLLLELWTARLPQQIQGILSCSNEPLAQQVIMADKIFETMDHNSIQALSTPTDFAKYICQLELNLCKKISIVLDPAPGMIIVFAPHPVRLTEHHRIQIIAGTINNTKIKLLNVIPIRNPPVLTTKTRTQKTRLPIEPSAIRCKLKHKSLIYSRKKY